MQNQEMVIRRNHPGEWSISAYTEEDILMLEALFGHLRLSSETLYAQRTGEYKGVMLHTEPVSRDAAAPTYEQYHPSRPRTVPKRLEFHSHYKPNSPEEPEMTIGSMGGPTGNHYHFEQDPARPTPYFKDHQTTPGLYGPDIGSMGCPSCADDSFGPGRPDPDYYFKDYLRNPGNRGNEEDFTRFRAARASQYKENLEKSREISETIERNQKVLNRKVLKEMMDEVPRPDLVQGDIVVQKGREHRPMTLHRVLRWTAQDREKGNAVCVWFENSAHYTQIFPLDALERYTPSEV